MKSLPLIVPDGCTLSVDELVDQQGRAARLLPSVATVTRSEDELRVSFGHGVDRALVDELVATERGCCSFLEVDYDDSARLLRIGAQRRAGARGRRADGGVLRGGSMSEGNGNALKLTAKDFKSDQEVRWCPGCGDYAILNAVQSFMPELGLKRENIVFVSGIGCAARFPYYMQTYGMHSIHGRAPAIATGLSVSRPDLSVWVVTGDGDSMSIGGNHLIHALRRNVNLKLLIFNNEIYGLTKGQYSPTSRSGTVTKSTPMGSIDHPFNPLSLAIGAEASFVARAIDTDKKELTEVLRAAAHHKGSAFVEIYQNCNIYNDGAFDFVREEKENRLYLRHGEPIVWGDKGVRLRPDGSPEVVAATEPGLLVHDAHAKEPAHAFALSRMTQEVIGATPMGVFRAVERPVYDELMAEQISVAKGKGEGELEALLGSGDTWTI